MVIRYLCISLLFFINVSFAFKWNPFTSDFNACDMTYMWRYPKYMDVGFKHTFKGYSLWLYGEGFYAQNFMQNNKVDGLPIIFVPGNAGSGKQARSIGSILQNKTDLRHTPFHFDVFTLDFNEQFSGLSSTFILKQADFLEASIQFILKMYSKPPPGIILIGHSMGGIVIREVMKRPAFDLNQVSLVLTFATPHLKPRIIVDSGMYKLWRDIEAAWNDTRIASSHIRVVSVSSGIKDEMISELLARSPNPSVYHFVTTGIDRVWVEADHQCIVWCNQIVRHTSRLIFYYAENLKSFRGNVDSTIKMFYSGVGREMKKILPKGNVAEGDTVCTESEACVGMGVVGISKTPGKIIIAIGKASNYQLITAKQQSCSPEVRHLNENQHFSLIEEDECVGEELLVNTNASKLWIVNGSQIYLSPLTLKSSLFHTEARRFTVSKGIRQLNISFAEITPTSVFVIAIHRKCSEGEFRVIFDIEGIQRFDEFSTKEKTQKIIRILSHSKKHGILTFFDTEKCSYDIKIEQDWKNTVKLAVIEWIDVLPSLIFGCLSFFILSSSVIPNSFTVFGLIGIASAAGSSLLFTNMPYIVFFLALTAAFIIYQTSLFANAFLTRRTLSRASPSIIFDLCMMTCCILLSLFLHPFIGALIAASLTSIQNRSTPPSSAPLKLFFILLLSIPGIIYLIEVIQHSGELQYPWDCFTLASFFFIVSSFFGFYQHFRVALLSFATAIPLIWSFDFTSHILAIDFQTSIVSLIYAWSLQ